jgi:hypothetical protein
MNTNIKIYSPRPLRRSVFSFPDKNSLKSNNSKFLCPGIMCGNPFNLHICAQESPKIIDNQPSAKVEVCAGSARNSTARCSPIEISDYEEDFFDFKKNLAVMMEENVAKSEILSILSTDNNDSNGFQNNIRSSMPPLRPLNPIFKTLHMEDSTESPLSEISVEYPTSKNRKSVHSFDLESK